MNYRERIATVESWFGDHRATRVDSRTVYWAKPDTAIYSMNYFVSGPCLFAAGDLGHAIYRWPERVSFEWIAKTDLDYFASKCVASPTGRGGKEWCAEKAATFYRERIQAYPSMRAQVENAVRTADLPGAIMRAASPIDLCDHRETFSLFTAWFPDIFDEPNAGMVVSIETIAHWRGLQMAVAALDKTRTGGVT